MAGNFFNDRFFKGRFSLNPFMMMKFFGGGLIFVFLLIGAFAHFGAVYIFFKEFGIILAIISFFFPIVTEIIAWLWCLFSGAYLWYVIGLPLALLIAVIFIALPVFLVRIFIKRKLGKVGRFVMGCSEPIDVTPKEKK